MPIYLKIVLGDWRNASRDKRELRVAMELGYKVIVIATTKDSKKVFKEQVEEFEVVRIPTRKYGTGKIQALCSKLVAIISFILEARKINASVISGHNYSGWIIGYLAHGKRRKVKYIYDSHEYELCQKERGFIAFHMVKELERFVVKHSDINMMVTDSISQEVQRIYKLPIQPLVVRNVPEKIQYDEQKAREHRQEFFEHLSISANGMILMYHGGLAAGRGIEESIKAVSALNDVGLVLMGYALDDSYEKELSKYISDLNCEDRVYRKPAVSFSELYENIAAVDVGIVLIQNTCKSFLYSLPNKLFENIQALTPIIGSDFPEIGHIIDKYGVGIKIKPDDVNALIEAIETMRTDKDLYNRFKENLLIAREELCWEREKLKLKKVIESL